MDNYNNITNEEFIQSFLDELYTRTDFTQVDEPGDLFDPEQEYGKHIMATQENLYKRIRQVIKNSNENLSSEVQSSLFENKRLELFNYLNSEIETYIEKVNVDYR